MLLAENIYKTKRDNSEYVCTTDINYVIKERCDGYYTEYYGKYYYFKRLREQGYTHVVNYVFNHYRMKVKDFSKSSDIVYDEIKGEMLEYAKEYMKEKYPGYEIELSIGKRGYDKDEYESFVVYHGSSSKSTNYIGGFELTQNKFGDVECEEHHVLAGHSEFDFDINNWKKEIGELIDRLCGK